MEAPGVTPGFLILLMEWMTVPSAEQGTEGKGWTGGREGGPGVPSSLQSLSRVRLFATP